MTTDHDLDDLLGALRGNTPAMTEEAFDAGRSRLLAAASGAPPPVLHQAPRVSHTARTEPAGAGRARWFGPWLVAAAVLVVATVAVTTLPEAAQRPPGTESTFSVPSPAAPSGEPDQMTAPAPGEPLPAMPAQPVNRAADLAATVSDLSVGAGQYLYVRTVESNDRGGHLVEELWVPADRNTQWLRRRVGSGVQGAPDPDENGGREERYAEGGYFDGPVTSPWVPTPTTLALLPDDPAGLYQRLQADNERVEAVGDPAVNAIAKLLGLLGNPNGAVIPAELRATIYRTLGHLPGLVITDGVRTLDGRTAVALGYIGAGENDSSYRLEVLVDPANGRVIGGQTVALRSYGGRPDGTVISQWSATQGAAGGLGQPPAG